MPSEEPRPRAELSAEELEAQQGQELPDREAMSIINNIHPLPVLAPEPPLPASMNAGPPGPTAG